jgi:phosphate starvation-inducible PhoH-like protein
MQNSSTVQFKTILTRVGEGSKLVINGDLQQNDNVPNNGLYDFLNQLYKYLGPNNVEYIDVVNLYNTDIIRNPCIKEILDIYSFGGGGN